MHTLLLLTNLFYYDISVSGQGLHIAGDYMYPGQEYSTSVTTTATPPSAIEESEGDDTDGDSDTEFSSPEADGATLFDPELGSIKGAYYTPSPYLALQACKMRFTDPLKATKPVPPVPHNGHGRRSRKAMKKAYRKQLTEGTINDETAPAEATSLDTTPHYHSNPATNDGPVDALSSVSLDQGVDVADAVVEVSVRTSWWSPLSEYLHS